MEKYFRIGVIASTHGLRGEVKVYPTTDDPGRFMDLKECILDTGKQMIPMEAEKARLFKGMAIVKFKGYDTIESIEPYKGKDLLVDREHAVPLEDGENYISDLIGLQIVSDEGRVIGELFDVLQTGANDVYVVKASDGKEVLIPVTKEFVTDVDLENSKITVHLIPGLPGLD